MEIKGRLVLITGASSGIGAATAKAMAREGGRILLLARTRSTLEAVAEEIKAGGGEAWVYPVDISDAAAVEQTALAIRSDVGIPDILVNNAGAGRLMPIEETSPEDAAQMMASPYTGAFCITRAFLREMRLRGTGQIVNVTSPAGFAPWPGVGIYGVARWAMRGFNEVLRAELHGTGLTVTVVVPGEVASPYFANNPGGVERFPGIAKLYRRLTPEDVADAIVHGVQRNKRMVAVPPLLGWTLHLHRFWPGIVEWLLFKTTAKLRP
jgi:NADP-dependent 3-hydroxy acid dehydrogenase YdfG